jgi:4-amino-4-deoxy-L-arabinose transferase-like glycosyltransferase
MKQDSRKAAVLNLMRLLLLLTAIFFIGLYVYVALGRLVYPFELEWMEGGSLVQVTRILDGEPLYVRPSFEFTPYIYTPLYFYFAAALAAVLGPGFLPLRFVSFAASLVTLALIYVLLKREGASWLAASAAAGLYAATFALSAAWFDVARVDSLLIMWMLLAVYLMRRGTRYSYALAGLVLGLAWFTKQTALIVLIVMGGYSLLCNWRNGVLLLGGAAALIGVGSAIWNAASGGWFSYYVFDLPRTHALILSMRTVIGFLFVDILLLLPVACWFGLWWFLWPAQSTFKLATRSFYAATALAWIGLAFMGRANPGGFPNVLMPAFAILAVLFGLGLELAAQVKMQLAPKHSVWFQLGVYGVALAQFAALLYPVPKMLPRERDWQAGEELLTLIRTTPGEVYVPYHGYLALRAGKKAYAHPVALDELYGTFGAQPVAEWPAVYDQMQSALTNHRFNLVIQDQRDWLQTYLDRDYVLLREPIFSDSQVFRPVTGRPTRPEAIYVPNP